MEEGSRQPGRPFSSRIPSPHLFHFRPCDINLPRITGKLQVLRGEAPYAVSLIYGGNMQSFDALLPVGRGPNKGWRVGVKGYPGEVTRGQMKVVTGQIKDQL